MEEERDIEEEAGLGLEGWEREDEDRRGEQDLWALVEEEEEEEEEEEGMSVWKYKGLEGIVWKE